ncbi:uncharacterized protein METZ01_LOCUS39623 [marine metagenome]|uniref:Uncharacterized protein n=1 Tax=marine metagenome TaxID=408172 RepID=A0A381R7J9_9ZZZZ
MLYDRASVKSELKSTIYALEIKI